MVSETDIKPYQFEPLNDDIPIVNIDDDENYMLSQSSSYNQDITDRNGERTTHINWCNCDHSKAMPSEDECLCCDNYMFERYCVELGIITMVDQDGPLDDNEPMNIWIWHHLGKGNRRILPSSVVSKIRDTFPDPLSYYVGF
ncbi:hypothetical protein ACJMK2_026228 [Sinanodonta woodiana]|uniref:Uncharacterized protein n=1 Tax=Sinanodonta woodiana TaxID=1069815 RepID=A0ABD3XIY2_SINWO